MVSAQHLINEAPGLRWRSGMKRSSLSADLIKQLNDECLPQTFTVHLLILFSNSNTERKKQHVLPSYIKQPNNENMLL